MPGVLEIVEAAYRVEQPEDSWLRGVLRAARPYLDRGGGVEGYFVDCAEGFRAWGRVNLDVAHPWLWDDYLVAVPDAEKRRVHTFAPAGYSASIPQGLAGVEGWLSRHHLRGIMGVNAIDAGLRGASLVAHDGEGGSAPPTRAALRRWEYLGSHIAAGARLLRRGSEGAAQEAVLTPGGRVLHAEGLARAPVAREALREAARAIDRSRVREARGGAGDDALTAWAALVAGRWTLLDAFERDGRRFVVARPNAPRGLAPAPLSERERQVARAAALGHSNKLIAYELGLGVSTVATLLARARRKLGATGRVDLVRRVRETMP
ncbi:MAG: LuxR C-terminal-related transcriptional regulator [Polyangiales bacterium]